MSMMNFFVLTAAQGTIATQGGAGWGSGEVAVDPIPVSNASPGVGLNLNDNAVDYEPGGVVVLVDRYVIRKAVVDDPEYATYAPDLIAYLLTLPWCSLEQETIFAPPL